MMELVDMRHLKCRGWISRAGSIPALRTRNYKRGGVWGL